MNRLRLKLSSFGFLIRSHGRHLTMATQKELVFRRATLADYDEILSVLPTSEFTGDYLPDHFHMLMKSPFYHGFVYTENGKIIASGAVLFVDGGMSGVMRSGRISKEHQNKGLLRRCQLELLKRYPVQYAVSNSANYEMVGRHIKSGLYKLLMLRKCLFYSAKKDRILEIMDSIYDQIDTTATRILKESGLKQMMRNKDSYPKIFQDDRIVVHTNPCRLMESNVQIILNEKTRAVASYLENGEQTLLTFGTFCKQLNGEMFCTLDIYGTVGYILTTHLLLHLQHFLDQSEDLVTIEVRSKEFPDTVGKSMGDLGLTMMASDKQRRTEIYTVEQKITHSSL